MKVAIFMGSKSNAASLKPAVRCLAEFGIEYEAHILSAHRVPEVLVQVLKENKANGTECIIAAARLAAHLPGITVAVRPLMIPFSP